MQSHFVSRLHAVGHRVKVHAILLLACVLASGITYAQSAATYTDLHDFGGPIVNANGHRGRDGIAPTWNVTFDRAGNMVGTTCNGGRYTNLSFQGQGGGNVTGAGTVWE